MDKIVNNELNNIAPIWKRFVAFAIDTIIVLPFYMLIVLILNKIDIDLGINKELFSSFLFNPMFLTFILVGWIYSNGQSVGQKIMKLKILKMDNSEIGSKEAFLRILGWFASNISLGIGFLIMFFNKEHRGLHDYTSNSKVVDLTKNNHNLIDS